MAVVRSAVSALKAFFGVGGGKGSRIVSQNRAAKLPRGAQRSKAVRLPVAPKGAGAGRRGGAKAGGGGGG